MSAQDWTILIGVITTSIATIWNLWASYQDRKRKSDQEQERLKWADLKEEAEAEHRRKMEELQMVAIRQGGAAAKAAKQAQEAAVVSRREVTQRIEESAKERREQIATVTEKIDENTRVNEEAISTANGFNGKLIKLGESIEARPAQVVVVETEGK